MAASSTAPEVSYRLKFENRPGYFYVHIKCWDPDLNTYRAIVREGAKELEKTGHIKILAELDVPTRLSTAEAFWLTTEFPDLGLEDKLLAVVDARHNDEALNRFGDAAAHNLEITRRTFTSVEEAEQWLASN